MRNCRILIVGAGIAGPTLAFWLARHGFSPTVVEQASIVREGGQAIDIHGKAVDVLERMGLLGQVHALRTDIRGMDFVDDQGRTLARTTAFNLTGGATDGPEIEVMRTDLLNLLMDHCGEGSEYVFGDRLIDLTETGTGVSATFQSGSVRESDLVIGADGIRSKTRRLAFDPASYRISRLGRYIAIGSIPNFLNYDRWQTFYSGGPDRRVMYFSGSSATRVMFTKSDSQFDIEQHDEDGLRRVLRENFGGDGWQTPRLLEEITTTANFYFDDLRQVIMDRWYRGRVALVGDAGYCASPAAGLGTTLAIIGAYVLAGELKVAQGDHVTAFERYDQRMRPFVDACQARARAGGNLYLGRFQFWLQLQQIRLSNLSLVRRLMTREAAGSKELIASSFDLPDYGADVPVRQ